jgi:hypothetical protein
MSEWKFRKTQLVGNVVQIELVRGDETTSITMTLSGANDLTAGLINALRAAEQRGSQLPPISLTSDQAIRLNQLPVDQYRVTTVREFPGRVFLHLLAAGGLYLTFGFDMEQAKFAGEALAGPGQARENTPPSETRQ